MDKEKMENTIENIYEIKAELLSQKINNKINNYKYKFKIVETNKILDEIKEKIIKKQTEQLIKDIEENEEIKNTIIMKEMYKQGFIDGINLIIDSTRKN